MIAELPSLKDWIKQTGIDDVEAYLSWCELQQIRTYDLEYLQILMEAGNATIPGREPQEEKP